MIEAALWGGVGGAALLVGAVAGIYLPATRRAIALVMGFGAGVLISALAFDLTKEAFDKAGHDAVAAGLALGALTFFAGDWIIDHRGGEHRKRSGGQQADGSPAAITLGALLDGIPESAAIGTTLLAGKGVSAAFVAAVFISNVPESLSAATGMQKAGHSTGWILRLWLAVMAVSALSAALGYGLLDGASVDIVAGIQAFAAGAILTMLADTMMPEAYEGGGSVVGLVTVLGFALAFFLSTFS
jgi:ZIP family zinc transporter